jgi:hypothetical protein
VSDYTPTTEEVRNAFSLMQDDASTQENYRNFDRWLAEVKAKTVTEWQIERLAAFRKALADDNSEGASQ